MLRIVAKCAYVWRNVAPIGTYESIHSHTLHIEILLFYSAYYLLLKYALLSNKKYALNLLAIKAVGKRYLKTLNQITP